jgi:EAL domain-containing protein (putative c-di-GMP-specific phosphodiesterase class I)
MIEDLLDDPCLVSVAFQPIFDVQSARTAGWEILCGFESAPQFTTDLWFAAAYGSGLGLDLEGLALQRALAGWAMRSPGTFMTVNVTPMALGSPRIEGIIAAQAPLYGLVIELTEQVVPVAGGSWQDACTRLRALGAKIAIDDIGTGHAELAQILTLRPDIIKLDRQVVATVDHDPGQQALVRFLGDFSDHLDAWLLAEGVERPGQLVTLRNLGVPLAQGWLTGRPAPEPCPCPVDFTTPEDGLALGCAPGIASVPERPAAGTVAVATRPVRIAAVGAAVGGGPDPDEPVVRLDAHGRPVAVEVRCVPGTGPRSCPVSLVVNPDVPVAEAARRAMSRPAGQRFDPLVCLDRIGHVVGVVAVQDLVLALASEPRL